MFNLVLCAEGEECANTLGKAYVQAVATFRDNGRRNG